MTLSVVPIGARLLRRLPRPRRIGQLAVHRLYIFIVTYLLLVVSYIIRRPLGVSKNALSQNCSHLVPPGGRHLLDNNTEWCSWKPFDHDSSTKFAWLDFTYRLSYSIAMFLAGYIAERMDQRLFLSSALMFSGSWLIFSGIAYFADIHSYVYFVIGQVGAGVSQSTAWPSVVTLMGNWFGEKGRGLVFGFWCTSSSVGNILGIFIAAAFVNFAWGYSFVIPGLIACAAAIFAYFFIIVDPESIGIPDVNLNPDVELNEVVPIDANASTANLCESAELELSEEIIVEKKVIHHEPVHDRKPITIWGAILIPGVVEYSICLFFCKAVYYAFFFWLPVYIKANLEVGNEMAADISAAFDGGGLLGGIIAGGASDLIGGSATVCGVMLVVAIPVIFILEALKHGQGTVIFLLFLIGLLQNGPYSLITTAVSADLGTRPSLVGEQRSLSTVTAVIDAIGSLGSAFGPLIVGLLGPYGWHVVFYYLIAAQICSALCLSRLIYREWCIWVRHWVNA